MISFDEFIKQDDEEKYNNMQCDMFQIQALEDELKNRDIYISKLEVAYSKELERLNNIIENLTTMTVNGDRTQIKNTAQYKIDRAIEYHDNCVNNLLDLDKIEENERLAYRVAYEIHDNYLKILKGVDKE